MKLLPFFITFLTVPLLFSAEVNALRCTEPPTLDGILSEKDWQAAQPLTEFFINNSGTLAKHRTEARVLYDDEAIYVGFRAYWAPGKENVPAKRPHDSKRLGRDECVEIMLDPGATGSEYFHFFITAGGTLLDEFRNQGGYVANMQWDSEAKTSVTSNAEFWECETKIPFRTLDIPQNTSLWTINLCRGTRGIYENSSIAENGAFNNAGFFVPLKNMDIDFSNRVWRIAPPVVSTFSQGEKIILSLDTVLANNTGKRQTPCLEFILVGEHDAVCASVVQEMETGAEKNFTAVNLSLTRPGNYRCYISVKEHINGQILKRSLFPVVVAFSPVEMVLLDPHYRNSLFATQNIENVRCLVTAKVVGAKCSVEMRGEDGQLLAKATPSAEGIVTFPAKTLADGIYSLTAYAYDSAKELGRVSSTFRKLPFREGEVWLDKNGTWRVNGEKFFPLMEWNKVDHHIAGTNVSMVRFTAGQPPAGVKTLSPVFSDPPFAAAMYKKDKTELTEADRELIRSTAEKFGKDPNLFGYFLVDEPDNGRFLGKLLIETARIIRESDPYHPIVISNNTVDGMKDFIDTAEINGLHPYPHIDRKKVKANMGQVVSYMDKAADFYRVNPATQMVTYMQQSFNYSDYGAVNSRVPNFDEIRTEYLMAQILGAQGVFLYTAPDGEYYPEISVGLHDLIKEFNLYAGALLETEAKDARMSATEGLRWIARRHRGHFWLFAVSTTADKIQGRFSIPELGNKSLQVVGENRSIAVSNGVFIDSFDNYQVHVYTTDHEKQHDIDIAKTENKIREANAKRRAPGNLIHQDNEEESVLVSADSNAKVFRRPNDTLWHVADGIKIEKDYRGNRFCWLSKPGDLPVSLEIDFQKELSFSRAVIWIVDRSIKDYQLEALESGKWKIIGSVGDGNDASKEFIFPMLKATKVKLVVKALNGESAKVSEIEIFQQ